MEQKQMIEVAKKILAVNEECYLSGSLALQLQGHKLMREPKDLDIYCPATVKFVLPDGMKIKTTDGENDEYDDEYFERESYTFEGLDIDVFRYVVSDDEPFMDFTWKQDIHMIIDFEILKMKIHHAFGEHWTRHKHAKDVIHIMNQIR